MIEHPAALALAPTKQKRGLRGYMIERVLDHLRAFGS